MDSILYYFHDPMCSWCYAFRHSLDEIQNALPKHLTLKKIVAGLAKDSAHPMDEKTQTYVKENWQQIEQQVRDTHFNYDFWTNNIPIRSTYPACRAVLSAKLQSSNFEDKMIQRIQHGYYQQSQNPSLIDTLVEFAADIHADVERFKQDIVSPTIQQQLKDEIHFSRSIGVRSFPSLVLFKKNHYQMLSIDYNKTENMIHFLNE